MKFGCLKWARMTHLGTYNTSYGQKKGRESNCQFDSQLLKVGNRPDLLVCKWRDTYCWKTLDENYNFASNLTPIRGLHKKVMGLQSCKSPNFENFETHNLRVLGQNDKEYFKGEGGGFPQVRGMVNLMSPYMLVACLCTKSATTMHQPNLLFGLCKPCE